jgi:hypothetical protein
VWPRLLDRLGHLLHLQLVEQIVDVEALVEIELVAAWAFLLLFALATFVAPTLAPLLLLPLLIVLALEPLQLGLVCALLDLARCALPVRGQRRVLQIQLVVAEAQRSVARQLLAQGVHAPLRVLARHERLGLLVAAKPVLVQGTQSIDACLELCQRSIELFDGHPSGVRSFCTGASGDGRMGGHRKNRPAARAQ